MSPEEYKAYNDADTAATPAAKAAGFEAYLKAYPNSAVKKDALQKLMFAYSGTNDSAKTLDAAMFFSPKSARIFGVLADGLPTEHMTAFCISPTTAQALSPGSFGQIAVASKPNQTSMLALLD